MNETLEAIARALFKSWFVDFDPVQAKAEGRQSVGMDSETAALFPDSFQESELGLIPKGWATDKVQTITDVVDYVANGSFASLKANVTLFDEPEYALYVRTTDFKNGFKGKLKYTDRQSYKFLRKSKLEADDIIISNVGDTGTVFRPPSWFDMPMTLGSNAIALKSGQHSDYLYLHFISQLGQDAITSIVAGSAQPKFNKTDFRNLKIVVPSPEILNSFNAVISPLKHRQLNVNKETHSLEELRDALLPKLISGELLVPDAEKLLADSPL